MEGQVSQGDLLAPIPLEVSSRLGVRVSSPQGNGASNNQGKRASSPQGEGASNRRGVGVSNLGAAANRRDGDPSLVAGPSVPRRVEDAFSAPIHQVGLAPSLLAAEVPTLQAEVGPNLQMEVGPNLRAAEAPIPPAAEAIRQAEAGPSPLVAGDPSLEGLSVRPHLVVLR